MKWRERFVTKASLIIGTLLLLIILPAQTWAQADAKKKAPSTTQAVTKPPENWAQEPTSFLGIGLDRPFVDTVWRSCPTEKIANGLYMVDQEAARRLGVLCIDNVGPKINKNALKVLNYSVPLFLEVGVYTDDSDRAGKVESVVVIIEKNDFQRALEILTEKYGPAHRTSTSQLQTGGGATFENQMREWNGAMVSIRLDSFDERYFVEGTGKFFDLGRIRVMTRDYIKKLESAAKEATRQSASKL